MDTRYVSPDESKEYYSEEKCHILELLNLPHLNTQSIARARVDPGITTAWHKLANTSEVYYILSGKGQVEIGQDAPRILSTNELVFIPPDTKQRIKNIGETDLIFLCFCVPSFSQNNYISVE